MSKDPTYWIVQKLVAVITGVISMLLVISYLTLVQIIGCCSDMVLASLSIVPLWDGT